MDLSEKQADGNSYDYTKFPEGFEKLIEDLKLPFTDYKQRKAFLTALLDTLIKQ